MHSVVGVNALLGTVRDKPSPSFTQDVDCFITRQRNPVSNCVLQWQKSSCWAATESDPSVLHKSSRKKKGAKRAKNDGFLPKTEEIWKIASVSCRSSKKTRKWWKSSFSIKIEYINFSEINKKLYSIFPKTLYRIQLTKNVLFGSTTSNGRKRRWIWHPKFSTIRLPIINSVKEFVGRKLLNKGRWNSKTSAQ